MNKMQRTLIESNEAMKRSLNQKNLAVAYRKDFNKTFGSLKVVALSRGVKIGDGFVETKDAVAMASWILEYFD